MVGIEIDSTGTRQYQANRSSKRKGQPTMNNWKRILIGTVVVLFVTAISGCSQNEHRKTTIRETQHEGPVVEESHGEMIVE
ncbi:MAG: hypothetical protein JXO22_15140 [Phycisphaerae bacterium]|nr:hypothetical protein [Phycisphaerae bacterium]